MGSDEVFPRAISALEHKLLLWILPADRPGYAEYRNVINTWKVAGTRPWAEGSYLLAPSGSTPDPDASPSQLVAVGAVEGPRGVLSVNVRELQLHQLEFEISGPADQEPERNFERLRRWTLSSWSPTMPCPSCEGRLREVVMATLAGRNFVLALCIHDQRLWVFDDLKGMNLPVPVTGFYNEVMLQAKIQDPGIALQSRRLFSDLDAYTDAILTRAFEAYNRTRHRIQLGESLVLKEDPPASWLKWLGDKMFG